MSNEDEITLRDDTLEVINIVVAANLPMTKDRLIDIAKMGFLDGRLETLEDK